MHTHCFLDYCYIWTQTKHYKLCEVRSYNVQCVKQCHIAGVLFPIVLTVKLMVFEETSGDWCGGCHMGHRYSGAFSYSDYLTFLSPSRSGLSVLISECEKYVAEYDILFNGNKSKFIYFKGIFCKPVKD